jgi:pyruvate/2-oxoacid:ferredoxin oxidoreductase beta subunit
MWCAGCSNGIVTRAIIDAILGLELDPQKLAVIAGIGCAGRITSYLDYSTVHTAHARRSPSPPAGRRPRPARRRRHGRRRLRGHRRQPPHPRRAAGIDNGIAQQLDLA